MTPAKIAKVATATTHAVIRRIRMSRSFAFRAHFAIGASTQSASLPAPMCGTAARPSVLGTGSLDSRERDERDTMATSTTTMAPSTESATQTTKWLSLTGAAAAVLVVVSYAGLGGDTPGAEDTTAKIGLYYESHQVREMVAAFVLAAAAPFFVLFAIWLAANLRPAEAGRSIWQNLLMVGGGAAGVGFITAALMHIALVQTANHDGIAGGALQALAGLDENSWVASNSGLGVMMLGAAGTVLASKAYPVLGWI